MTFLSLYSLEFCHNIGTSKVDNQLSRMYTLPSEAKVDSGSRIVMTRFRVVNILDGLDVE